MRNEQAPAERATRRLRQNGLVLLIAAATVLVLAGCGLGQRTTLTPTPTAPLSSPTPAVTQPPTQQTTTPTTASGPPTVTLIPTQPTSTPTPTRPTATPTSPPTATFTASPVTPEAVILTFRADVDVADPGDTITLTWVWSGGQSATIYHLFPTGQLSEPYWDVGPTGSLQYTISPERRNEDGFVLYVYDGDGVAAQDTVQVTLRCPDAWFFSPPPDICPASPPLISNGAQQAFERGTMLWVGAEDRIYVLFDDGQDPRWSAYTDEWDEGEPTVDPGIEPPSGLQQPVRGFGLVWREEPSVRERLGWAVEEERGYETAVQRTSHVRYPVLYIRALGSGVWELGPNGSAWELLSP